MNFAKAVDCERPRLMADGDLVIVYERHDTLSHIYLAKDQIFQNKFGSFYHNDIIGKPFGSKISSKTSHGWVYFLEPTPELWASALNTRTQIVNEMDSSIVTLNLDVFPGSVVVESGTGSGCMTLSLARAVYPNGHVYTFEYNGVRAQKAREEFEKLGVNEQITVTHKDVCGKFDPSGKGGFVGVPDHCADSVFLDLPEPWLALDHALLVLKAGGNICCYSPCIEQVMKTCEKLRELKFHSIRMIEVRQRPYDGRVMDLETLDLGVTKPVPAATNNKADSSNSNNDTSSGVTNGSSSVRAAEQVAAAASTDEGVESGQSEDSRKRKLESGEEAVSDNKTAATGSSVAPQRAFPEMSDHEYQLMRRTANQPKSSVNGTFSMKIARPVSTMKGHTAFLTFAMCPL